MGLECGFFSEVCTQNRSYIARNGKLNSSIESNHQFVAVFTKFGCRRSADYDTSQRCLQVPMSPSDEFALS